jgi:hypothetical protein
MSDDAKQPMEVVLIGVAWAQFIAVSATVDKADMRNLAAAWEQVTSSPWMWQWDWTKFGGVAVALNILAVCLLTLPALARSSGWEGFQNKPNSTRAFLLKLRSMGFYAWLFSFIAFIGYLNFMSVICLYASLVVIVVLVIYYRYLDTDAE